MRPRTSLRVAVSWLMALASVSGLAVAHEGGPQSPLIIDTDMGLDDAVALALALTSPRLEIAAVVTGEGVAGAESARHLAEALLDRLNRSDVPLFSHGPSGHAAPPFRATAEERLRGALTAGPPPLAENADAGSYAVGDRPVVVLALGPLTHLAAALEADPELCAHIASVIVSGNPADPADFNLGYDAKALATLHRSGVPTVFVAPGAGVPKPARWRDDPDALGRSTSLGDRFLHDLLADPATRQHYLEGWPTLVDELALLSLLEPDLFTVPNDAGLRLSADPDAIGGALAERMARGRQAKQRVVFTDEAFPPSLFVADVRERLASILARNGDHELFAQLLLNELHEHLGAYSIIGVKMGLHAAEQLNAPPHAMRVTATTPATPPMSCLCDGLLVATGSTPGRGLFAHVVDTPQQMRVRFEYNGRQLTLRLRPEYAARIRDTIRALRSEHSLEDEAYWDGVRRFGLDIWESWHRRDLFESVDPLPDGEERGT